MARVRAASRVASVACIGLLPIGATPKDAPPALRVASITYATSTRLDNAIIQECDVARIVTDAIQRGAKKSAARTDLVLRIDRVVRVGGNLSPGPTTGGTELGVSVLSVAGKQADQPFLCRKEGVVSNHCSRLEYCGKKIAGQISSWVAWKK